MGKFFVGLACGVLGTLVIWFGVTIYPDVTRDSDERLRDVISVQKHRKTGHYTIKTGFESVLLGKTKGTVPLIVARVGDDGYFHLSAKINQSTTLVDVGIFRNMEDIWDGRCFRDEIGQEWELVYASPALLRYREKFGSDIYLKQGIWIADRVYMDGTDVFFERIRKGDVYDRWKLVSSL